MLKKLFLTPFLLFSFSLQSAASEIASVTMKPVCDLGTVTVEAPAWNYPESITGSPDGEVFFETLPVTGRSTLTEALDGQMGISLRSSGGAGSIAALSAGGLSGNKILVVKDGMPVNDPFSGSPDIGDYSTMEYDSAELWEGNRATLWGSSSIGGTLRLTSRFPDYGRLRLWTDGHGGQGTSIETRLHPGRAKLGVRVGQFKTPGFSAAAQENGNCERDAFAMENAFLAMETDLNRGLELQISSGFNESLTDLDGFDFVSGLPIDNLDFRQKKIGSQFNCGLVKALADGELRFVHGFVHSNLTGIDESNPFNEYGLESSRQRQAVSRSFTSDRVDWLVEISRSETRAKNAGIFSLRETDSAGVVGCESKLWRDTIVNAVVRHDDPQNHQAVSTGNLSVQQRLDRIDFTAAWGRAFRMPALNERYYPAYGDPDLGAEYSTSVGLSAGGRIEGLGRLEVALTQYRVCDLIGTTATTDPAYAWGIKAANLDRAKIISHRILLSDCRLAGWELDGNFTMMDKARLENTGRHAPGIASRQAAIMIGRKIGQMKYSCQGRWWGHVWEDAENTRAAQASHDLALFITRSFRECSLEMGLLNLTGADDQRVLGYTRSGRRLTLALEALF